MAYCTNCGTEIKNESKFCPSCGTKTALDANKSKRRPPPKRKMQKGVVKSLQDETTNYVKSKVKETIIQEVPKTKQKLKDDTGSQTLDKNTKTTKKGNKKWVILYFVFSFSLLYLFNEEDEIIGLAFFSIIVLITYFVRKKKEKPFNIFLKIILSLQVLLSISILMMNLEYMSSNGYSVLAVLLNTLLIFTIIMLFFKGNKK